MAAYIFKTSSFSKFQSKSNLTIASKFKSIPSQIFRQSSDKIKVHCIILEKTISRKGLVLDLEAILAAESRVGARYLHLWWEHALRFE